MEKIFEQDETKAVFKPEWSLDELLQQEGVFLLKNIGHRLGIDSVDIKKRAIAIRDSGKDPYSVMGCRKIWNHWFLRMKIFAPYYEQHLKPKVKKLNPCWDANALLKQKGVFALSDVCRLIPFSNHHFRYQVKKNQHAKTQMGVWKDNQEKIYLVKMDVFAPWLETIWDPRKTRSSIHGR